MVHFSRLHVFFFLFSFFSDSAFSSALQAAKHADLTRLIQKSKKWKSGTVLGVFKVSDQEPIQVVSMNKGGLQLYKVAPEVKGRPPRKGIQALDLKVDLKEVPNGKVLFASDQAAVKLLDTKVANGKTNRDLAREKLSVNGGCIGGLLGRCGRKTGAEATSARRKGPPKKRDSLSGVSFKGVICGVGVVVVSSLCAWFSHGSTADAAPMLDRQLAHQKSPGRVDVDTRGSFGSKSEYVGAVENEIYDVIPLLDDQSALTALKGSRIVRYPGDVQVFDATPELSAILKSRRSPDLEELIYKQGLVSERYFVPHPPGWRDSVPPSSELFSNATRDAPHGFLRAEVGGQRIHDLNMRIGNSGQLVEDAAWVVNTDPRALPDITLLPDEIDRLPFQDASVGLLRVAAVPDLFSRRSLSEMGRVLANGGQAVAVDANIAPHRYAYTRFFQTPPPDSGQRFTITMREYIDPVAVRRTIREIQTRAAEYGLSVRYGGLSRHPFAEYNRDRVGFIFERAHRPGEPSVPLSAEALRPPGPPDYSQLTPQQMRILRARDRALLDVESTN